MEKSIRGRQHDESNAMRNLSKKGFKFENKNYTSNGTKIEAKQMKQVNFAVVGIKTWGLIDFMKLKGWQYLKSDKLFESEERAKQKRLQRKEKDAKNFSKKFVKNLAKNFNK